MIHILAVVRLQRGGLKLNCHWGYFPQSDLWLPSSSTRLPAQPCLLRSYPESEKITGTAQLPSLFSTKNALGATSCCLLGDKIALLRLSICFVWTGLELELMSEAVWVHWDTLDWVLLEQNWLNGPKVMSLVFQIYGFKSKYWMDGIFNLKLRQVLQTFPFKLKMSTSL